MAIEIERKFLVNSDIYKQFAYDQQYIKQAYLSSHPERSVRIRIKNDCAYITVKGKSSENGLSRYEWEKEIPVSEAEELLLMCEPGGINKIRYKVKHEDVIVEIDEFFGENEGLVMAEVELSTEIQEFTKPEWLGAEVTGDKKYYNSMLSKNPYINW